MPSSVVRFSLSTLLLASCQPRSVPGEAPKIRPPTEEPTRVERPPSSFEATSTEDPTSAESSPPFATTSFAPGTKKGIAAVGYQLYPGSSGAHYTLSQGQAVLDDAKPHFWYDYTFSESISPPVAPNGGVYMPMFWDLLGRQYRDAPVFDDAHISIAASIAGPDGYIMFLNEPYNGTPGVDAGAVDPVEAAKAWEQLASHPDVIANDIRLVAPGWTNGGNAPSWHERFWANITRKPDVLSVHLYTGDSVPAEQGAADILRGVRTLMAQHPGFPVMITELGIGSHPTPQQTEDLWDALIPALELEPRIAAYCWFYGGPRNIQAFSSWTTALYNDDGTPTSIGAYYRDNFP
ncbi:MAG TPA: glycosyl hydrolase [Polyangiaceae bacterium]|nr:glycosyl hydrolase [Polyangiaceae bacterium]